MPGEKNTCMYIQGKKIESKQLVSHRKVLI